MNRSLWLAFLCGGLTLAGNCGCSGPVTCRVSGEVSFDDKPLPKGTILFRPVESTDPPDQGDILDGKYVLNVKPGKQKVEIRALELIPGAHPEGDTSYRNYIPECYNIETKLVVEVSTGSANQFNFDLKR